MVGGEAPLPPQPGSFASTMGVLLSDSPSTHTHTHTHTRARAHCTYVVA